jgi:3-methyladenine DNA glycosylase AlkD
MNDSEILQRIQNRLRQFASKEKASILRRFFKTGPGEYGEGDKFLGVVVPNIRKVAKEFQAAPQTEVRKLLSSPFHEERLLALLILVRQYETGDDALKKKIYGLYLKSSRYINNWDLVDLSAPNIAGAYLLDRSRSPLYTLAESRDLWKRRIAIMATFAFIRQNDFADTLALSRMLLPDGHDLIHKAVGWMLREVGKRDVGALEGFLRKHYRSMPRTMLRYAIERLPEAKREKYLNRE